MKIIIPAALKSCGVVGGGWWWGHLDYTHCPFFVGMPSCCYYSGGLDSTFLQGIRIKQSFSGFHPSEIKNYAQVNISMENLSFAEDHNSSFPILLKKFFGISS